MHCDDGLAASAKASSAQADHNLLFGTIALQVNLVTQDQFVAAFNLWVQDKSRSLAEIFESQHVLATDQRQALEALLAIMLKKHGGDPKKSLAVLSPVPQIRPELDRLNDPDIAASLGHVAHDSATDPPRYETVVPIINDRLLGRFKILRPHAKGGVGTVSVAFDQELNREVALKEIQHPHADDETSRKRFVREAEITGGLEHPGIVPVYALGQGPDGRPFYAMRLIRGVSLESAIDTFHKADNPNLNNAGARRQALRQLLSRFIGVCNAIEYAHNRKVLHRDLKPANIMVGEYGETLVVDWGLAKVAENNDPKSDEEPLRLRSPVVSLGQTQPGKAIGTPNYMSPEQAAGKLDELTESTDVYSLGATLFHLLCGRPPFQNQRASEILTEVQQGDFPKPRSVASDVSGTLEAICLKAMALQPANRYASVRALREDLDCWLADRPVTAAKDKLWQRVSRFERTHRVYVRAAVLIASVVICTVIGTSKYSAWQSPKLELRFAKVLEDKQRADRAAALVDQLRNAEIGKVTGIIDELAGYRDIAEPLLVEEHKKLERGSPRLNLALAILRWDDSSMVIELQEELVRVAPNQFTIVRDALKKHKSKLVEPLWKLALNDQEKVSVRFQSACALAAFSPDDNEKWKKISKLVADHLVTQEASDYLAWREALDPAKLQLIEALKTTFRRHEKREQPQRYAAETLAAYFAEQPKVLFELLADAEDFQFPVIFDRLSVHGAHVVDFANTELAIDAPEKVDDEEKEKLARRRANAAVAMALLGEHNAVWPVLQFRRDPRARSYLIHWLATLKADPQALVKRYYDKSDPTICRAVLLALGEFSETQFSMDQRESLIEKLLIDFEKEPDAGLHAAVEWLLQKWKQASRTATVAAKLRSNELQLQARRQIEQRKWYVNTQGQTFVVLDADQFQMGAPDSDPDQQPRETLHRQRIGRRFAIAATEVTKGQFERFQSDRPEVERPDIRKWVKSDDSPQTMVDWYDAANYCNWLSEQEKIDVDQWCYEPTEAGIYAQGMRPRLNYLDLIGYRLPTEAEWEFACRAGTTPSRYYGSTERLLPEYARYVANGANRTWPVNERKPNDFGLFGMLGNAYEWCHERRLDRSLQGDEPVADTVDVSVVTDVDNRVLRGGSYFNPPAIVRSAYRNPNVPSFRTTNFGFRPARTYK